MGARAAPRLGVFDAGRCRMREYALGTRWHEGTAPQRPSHRRARFPPEGGALSDNSLVRAVRVSRGPSSRYPAPLGEQRHPVRG